MSSGLDGNEPTGYMILMAPLSEQNRSVMTEDERAEWARLEDTIAQVRLARDRLVTRLRVRRWRIKKQGGGSWPAI